MEMLDIVNEDGLPTGQRCPRETAHARGLRHRTSHVWLARLRGGKPQILLQKRSEEKDSNPGCYDISSAGHIPAGEDWVPSALRELREELGLTARPEELHYCGTRRFYYEAVFHQKPFRDRQVSRVYLLWRDVEPEALSLQKSELSGAVWMDFEEVVDRVTARTIPHCIRPDELEMVRRGIEETRPDRT